MTNNSSYLQQAIDGADVGPRSTVRTGDGDSLEYRPVYSRSEGKAPESEPGEFPYTRGIYPSMYLERPWTVRQYAGFSTADESNRFYKSGLAQGQKGLSVAFDLPTHCGYDSDHPVASGDVGKAGVAIDSARDMERLFEGIPLDRVSVSMTMSGAVLPVLASYIVAAERQGASTHALRGTIQNDILKEFLVRNTYIYPPQPSMRIVADVVEYACEHMPKFNPISISGYHLQEAGASPELELAYTLANGLEYIRHAVGRGLEVDRFAPRLSFFFGIGMNFFAEVAKLRAARKLWAELVTEHFAPKQANSTRLRMHCQTSGVSLTAQRPMNNVVRTTIEAMAAVLGGTQSLHTNSYDEALALPTEQSAAVARDTQHILREETDLTRVVDPLAGSYLVEDLTDQLVSKVRKLLLEIEEAGGMISAIERGLPQSQIMRAAVARQSQVDSGQRRVVGVNLHAAELDDAIELRFVENREVLLAQTERLRSLREGRDEAVVTATLERLRETARHPHHNLMTAVVECMRQDATVGEVSAALEDIFGRHHAQQSFVSGAYGQTMTDDQEFEDVRKRVERFEKLQGRRPRLLIAKLGLDGHDRGAKVVATGFSDAGFEVDFRPLFQSPEEVARAAVNSDAHVIGISTLAGGQEVLMPRLMRELKRLHAQHIQVVCGGIVPRREHATLKRLGLALILEPGMRVATAASAVLSLLEREVRATEQIHEVRI